MPASTKHGAAGESASLESPELTVHPAAPSHLPPAVPVRPSRWRRAVRQLAAWVVVVVIASGAAWWLRDRNVTARSAATDEGPAVEAEGVRQFVVRDKGRKVWEVDARSVTISADNRFAIATGVSRAVLFRGGKPYLKLKARQVRLNQQTRDLDAEGAVSASGPHGLKLATERAHWNEAAQLLECPQRATAMLDDLKVEARDVTYNARQNSLRCPQPIKAVSARAEMEGAGPWSLDVERRRLQNSGAINLTIQRSGVAAVMEGRSPLPDWPSGF